MAGDADLKPEIAHVLTIDVVAYSMQLISDQSRTMADLTRAVRSCRSFREAEAEGKLIRLPTGDGMALVFFTSPHAPLECAMELSEQLRELDYIQVRMGIHSGPVQQLTDVNDRANVAGAGIDTAQRVMDCGDAGHILLSKRVADDLAPYPRWNKHLHELGECEVKHGRRVSVVNFYTDSLGNPALPTKFRRVSSPDELTQARKAAAKRHLLIGAVGLLVVLAALGLWWWWTPPPDGEPTVAVLRFRNHSAAPLDYLADGISDQISHTLGYVSGLRVLPRSSLKDQPEDLRAFAREIGAAFLVDGSVSRSGDRTRVIASLIDIVNGKQIPLAEYEKTEENIVSLQNEVAQRVVAALQLKLRPEEKRQLSEPPTYHPKAWDDYMRARHLLNRRTPDSVKLALQLFERAVAADPEFALGHAGIAEAYIHLGKIGEIPGDDAAARAGPEVARALELDPRLAEAYVTRAILLNDFEWNWPGAEADYRRAISLQPNNAVAHHWFARHQAQLGNFDEALKLIETAQTLDPVAPMVRVTRAKILLVARRYSEALAPCNEALELEPQFASAFSVLGQARAQQGDYSGGIEAARRYVELSGGSGWAQLELAYAYAVAGNRAATEQLITTVTNQQLQFSPYDMATIYSALGETEQALTWLDRALEQRSVDVIWLRVDPRIDPIRTDAGFQRALARLVPRS
jgi:TolB-like protein/class 3 adenylate cyclase/lipoprotein NlpI